jgi:IS605 OrfB family transposase
MKLTAKVKLLPSTEQTRLLRETLERANTACDWISGRAWDRQAFGQFNIHRLAYREARERFGLAAQVVVQCVSKVADAYKRKQDRKRRRRFKPHGAIAYDSRILNWRLSGRTVSIWCLGGRQVVPFAAGERQLALLGNQQGETDLALIDGRFYLFAACKIEVPDPADVTDVLGVDMGIANLATDSDGEVHSSAQVNGLRHRHRRLRRRLQKKGTRSARRLLRRRRCRESRFAADTNHVASKRIVAKAQGTGRGIALEDLNGIRARITVKKSRRAALHSWSFGQLRAFIAYKARRAGVPVFLVDPRNTSRTCPGCGCVHAANRRSQAFFSCVVCGLSGPADRIAAVNIGRRAAVDLPNATREAQSILQGRA